MKRKTLLSIVLAVVLFLIGSSVVLADGAQIAVNPDHAASGQAVTVTGKGFDPNSGLTITVSGVDNPIGDVTTDSSGAFTAKVTIPDEAAIGDQTVTAVESSGSGASAPLSVDVAPGLSAGQFATGLAASVPSLFNAAELFIEGTIAAALAVLWLVVLALQLARPYMMQVLQKFSLRLAADLWWLVYIGAREMLLVVAFILSLVYFLPGVVGETPLPITGPVATAMLFGALLIKLVRDSDEDDNAFLAVNNLLAAGAVIYIGGYLLGIGLQGANLSGTATAISAYFISTSNAFVALGLSYVSLAAVSLMGIYAVYHNLRIASHEIEREQLSESHVA